MSIPTKSIIALIPVLTFSLLVIIILALCIYKSRCCCKFKDAEHVNTQRTEISTVFSDAEHVNPENIPICYPEHSNPQKIPIPYPDTDISKELRSRPDNVPKRRTALKSDDLQDKNNVWFSSYFDSTDLTEGENACFGSLASLPSSTVSSSDDKPVVWAPPPPPPPPDPPNPNS